MLRFNQKIVYLFLISSFVPKIECSASATTGQTNNNELQITLPNQKSYSVDRLLSEQLRQATPQKKQELLDGMIQYTQRYSDRRKIHLKSLQEFMRSGTKSSVIQFNPNMQAYHAVPNTNEDDPRIPDTVAQESLQQSHLFNQSTSVPRKLGRNVPVTNTYQNRQNQARELSQHTSWHNYFNEHDENGDQWYPENAARVIRAMPNGDQIWLDNQGNIIQISHHHFDMQGKMKDSGQEFIAQTQQLGKVIESFPNGSKVWSDRFGQKLFLTPEMIEENGLLRPAGRIFVLEENDFVREKKLAEKKRRIQEIVDQESTERQDLEEAQVVDYNALKQDEASAKRQQEIERRHRQEVERENRIRAAAQAAAEKKEAERQAEIRYRAQQAEAQLQQAQDIEQYEYDLGPTQNMQMYEEAGPPAIANGDDYQDV